MNETPRLRSAFPATPQPNASRFRGSNDVRPNFPSPSNPQPRPSPVTRPVQNATPVKKPENGPLVSLDVIDAPSQRFYVLAFYVGLTAWRLYNAWNVTDDLDSTWLFLKWLGIDAAFFVALPAFKIPWLEWSFFTTITIWLLHVVANAFLMYKIPIPILTWLGALAKIAYDRELSISEHRVKPADILHNSSIILGKQIIQILPEGSAVLNPEKRAFCLDSTRTSIDLPIQINQTTPISIELLRHDLDTDEVETIVISAKQARKLKSEADRLHPKSSTNTPRLLHYPVSKKGVYELSRVIDQSKLDVRKRSFDVAVVACPRASVTVDAVDKCTGDLSGISLHVEGVPPFQVTYNKKINGNQFMSITQSVQPEDLAAEMEESHGAVLDPKRQHLALTRSREIDVQINESLEQNGTWSYHVEAVEDGLANKIVFHNDKHKKGSLDEHSKGIVVHRRPTVKLNDCGPQKSLMVAKEASTNLPVLATHRNQMPAQDWPLKLKYNFIPETDGETAPAEEHEWDMVDEKSSPKIHKAGRYNLESISSQFCPGEILEPSSCTLYNPPRPDLTMQYEEIFDKCAGNPIGMELNLDFVGTPPFTVKYTVSHRSGRMYRDAKSFNGMRGQIRFNERSAGSYMYQIDEIADRLYTPISLSSRNFVLTQDIKPPARAAFNDGQTSYGVCQGQPIPIPVRFEGEGPWELDYEIAHAGKRKKFKLQSEEREITIDFPEQSDGGRYSVILTAVQDRTRCKQVLADERQIEVRTERPLAAFGDIEGRRTVKSLEHESVNLPLRLQGIGPWTVLVRNTDTDKPPERFVRRYANDAISVKTAGTFELVSVHDSSCPGTVDPKASRFQVSWIQRPGLSVKDPLVVPVGGNQYRRAPVCQGDEDSLSLSLSGNPPYSLEYQQRVEPLRGSAAVSNKPLKVATNNVLVNMDTSKAGEHTYTFNKLADDVYKHDHRHFSSIVVKQRVHALPSARFANPGKTYSYCKEDPALVLDKEGETEVIDIVLDGEPPFSLEIAISHHGASRNAEITRIRDIKSHTYPWHVSRAAFDLGTHSLQIRSVKDARDCESIFDTASSSVRIHVSSPPTIIPLESSTDYCVGDRVSFSLSGQAPFDVFYTFQNNKQKAQIKSNEFRRIAKSPGDFIITGVSDSAMSGSGKCKARQEILKTIHPYPSVKISQGKTMISDIHEGGEVDIHFEFTGTPPFEFTYTRSENAKRGDKKKPTVLETRHDSSDEFVKTIRANEEGTYEVVAIKDRYCAYSAVTGARSLSGAGGGGAAKGLGWRDQKVLKNL